MDATRRVCVVVPVLLMLLIPPVGASQGTGSGEEMKITVVPGSWRADAMAAWSVDSGGGASSGGGFSFTASTGQPDAGLISQCGTVLAGGLWAGAVDLQPVFCNGFESGGTGSWTSVVGGSKLGESSR